MKKQVVLITGASSGIGKEAAKLFVRQGFVTYVTARKLSALHELQKLGCHLVALDVTEEQSRVNAIEQITREAGGVDILVNNAGYCQNGMVEELRMQEVQRQFDTNVFGLLRMCQLVLPYMRHQKSGRIINVGSAGGEFTTPGSSAYQASKHALESFSDGLRMELAPFGIAVSLIKPGGVKTNFVDNSPFSLALEGNPYRDIREKLLRALQTIYDKGSYGILTPEEVAKVIYQVATARKPYPRYRVGFVAKLMPFLKRTLGDRRFDKLLLSQLK